VGVPFDQVVALSSYAPPMSDLICRLKYHKQLDVAKVLGTLLADHVKLHHQTLPELLLAVPLHKTRLWQRGFNQSVEITRVLSKKLNLKANYQSLRKCKLTPLQTTLNARQRRLNLKGAFSLRAALAAKSVAVIDDVLTTGTTASEIAKLLKKNGVLRVEVWVLARTAPPPL